MARTRAVARRPANINLNQRRFRSVRELMDRRERRNLNNIKIKFVFPQGKNVEVKQRGDVVRRMRVRRHAIFPAKVRRGQYGY